MKTFLPLFLLLSLSSSAQVASPVTKANFGVDADLRAYFYNGFAQPGDDWFTQVTGVEPLAGMYVIDTTGAAAMMARYAVDPAFRKQPFYRTMRYKPYTLVGPAGQQRAWIDAIFIRDYNGSSNPGDETAFLMSNKNGDSPANWVGGTNTVGSKVDIADIMVHVRRQGATAADPLWFFGGLSLQSNSGDRYFDFELYQTDIFFNRSTGRFSGYGPDAGHTSWKFDAAGNIISSGDVIFSSHFGTNGLAPGDGLDARIWVDRAALSITPVNFDWGGIFEGASNSSQYGYASIKPKTTGNYYWGVQSKNNTWAGPFGYIDAANALQVNYTAGQFLEIGVDLTFLGLDPMTILGGGSCGLPFRRILVKTRQSGSFTSNLADFIGPFDFFTSRPVQALADVPFYCGTIGASQLSVIDPYSGSVYNWSTPDGNIVTNPAAPSITVDAPGTYIVTQQLLDGCNASASDTITILYDASCVPMAEKAVTLSGHVKYNTAFINWVTKTNAETEYFEIQRSENGRDFQTVGKIMAVPPNTEQKYAFENNLSGLHSGTVYYRLKIKKKDGSVVYSAVIRLSLNQDQKDISIYPNPVNDVLQLSVPSAKRQEATVSVFDISGALLKTTRFNLQSGINMLQLDATPWKPGTYMVNIVTGSENVWKKFVVNSTAYNK